MKVIVSPSRISGTIDAPQSKSYAIRYIFCSTIAPIELYDLALSNDVEDAIEAVKVLGIEYIGGKFVKKGGELKIVKDYLYLRGSATTLRMFIPIALIVGGKITIDGDESLRRRPLKAIIESLENKGVKFSSRSLPLTIEGKLRDTYIEIPGYESSQYVSGFMIAFAIAGGGTIKITPPIVSKSYINLTASILKKIGVDVNVYSNRIEIDVKDRVSGYTGKVPGDYLLASFYVSSALLTNGRIEVRNLPQPEEYVGDHIIVDVYKAMGAQSIYINGVWIAEASESHKGYRGIDIDVEDSPDMALSIVPLASIADGITNIENVSRLRIKESDRVTEIVKVLKSFGIEVYTDYKRIRIRGSKPVSGKVVCPNDHRIAMMATPIALRVGGVIDRAECVEKSNPNFWNDIVKLGGKIEII
ncbi:MAG: 3-phosphoshikimate 1-carboxyvinyltransferase [Ignisphaera sp.]